MPSADVWRFPSDFLEKKWEKMIVSWNGLTIHVAQKTLWHMVILTSNESLFRYLCIKYNAQLKNSDHSLNGNGTWIYISNMHRLLSLNFFSDNKNLLYYNSCMRPCACILLTLPWIELNTWQCKMRKLKTLIIFWLWMLVKFWYQIYAQASEFWSLLTMKFPIL